MAGIVGENRGNNPPKNVTNIPAVRIRVAAIIGRSRDFGRRERPGWLQLQIMLVPSHKRGKHSQSYQGD
jgi:hypothetical protein